MQERGFAAAARPGHREKFSALYLKRYAVQRDNLGVVHRVTPADVSELN
jgi:hypothetical protein